MHACIPPHALFYDMPHPQISTACNELQAMFLRVISVLLCMLRYYALACTVIILGHHVEAPHAALQGWHLLVML